MIIAEAGLLTCTGCLVTGKAKPTRSGNLRLPVGWKRFAEDVFCKKCKSERFALRAVTFPVADVHEGDWKEFNAALKTSWGRATELANWTVRKLLAADRDRRSDDQKMFKLERVNLYRLWTDTYHDRAGWSGAAQSANAIMHGMEAKYRKRRFDVLWTNSELPPRMKYPVPYPVHCAAWKAEYVETTGDDGQVMKRPCVTVCLDGRKWTIILRGGIERARQLKAFAAIANGEAKRGELAVYRVRSYGSHRRTLTEAEPGGKVKVATRIMVKLVAYLPKKERRKGTGTLEVRTGKKALLVAMFGDNPKPWLYHAFQLRRAIYAYDVKRQKVADDLKAERRPASPHLREWLERAATKMNRKLDTECRMIAAMVAGYAGRCGAKTIRYSDDDRRYFERFPWGKLRLYLEQAADNNGLEFEDASGEVLETENSTDAAQLPQNNGDTPR